MAARSVAHHVEYDYKYGHNLEMDMSTFSVADAKSGLPRLIDRALGGEEIIISRHGEAVAELRPIRAVSRTGSATYDWLKSRRERREAVGLSSVELLDQLYDDTAG